jgi:hypothetical protein
MALKKWRSDVLLKTDFQNKKQKRKMKKKLLPHRKFLTYTAISYFAVAKFRSGRRECKRQ